LELLRKRIRYLLARNGTLETDALLNPLASKVNEIPKPLLEAVALFLEQEEIDILAQLHGTDKTPPEVENGKRWIQTSMPKTRLPMI